MGNDNPNGNNPNEKNFRSNSWSVQRVSRHIYIYIFFPTKTVATGPEKVIGVVVPLK